MNKIYLIVDYERAFYEGESESVYLKAVSNNLDQLCESFKNSNCFGQVIEIDEQSFNSFMLLSLSDESIEESPGVKNLGTIQNIARKYWAKKIKIK